jgi:hypothetical protein
LAQLCQNFGISGGGGFEPPKLLLGTPLICANVITNHRSTSDQQCDRHNQARDGLLNTTIRAKMPSAFPIKDTQTRKCLGTDNATLFRHNKHCSTSLQLPRNCNKQNAQSRFTHNYTLCSVLQSTVIARTVPTDSS